MRTLKRWLLAALLLGGGYCGATLADSPTCASPETKLSWPAVNPIWEMCWVRPSDSVATDGSSLELRKVYFKGHLVMRRAHVPMLFAEYRTSTCYRDWKDTDVPFLSDHAVQNKLGISIDPPKATTSCDRSKDPTAAYGDCPFQLSGYPNATASCAQGVSIEDGGDHVTLTTQHSAAWYQYTSRWMFYSDGRMEPQFGYGNNDGTNSSITHWHHNYWRMEFAIDDPVNAINTLSVNNVDKTTEFSDLRNATGGPGGVPKTWEVRNPVTGNGYRLVPSSDDYLIPTNESGRNFHTTDVMATKQHDGEYGDRSDNPLGVCAMNQNALVNSESLVNTAIALYYRVSVRDATNNNWPPGCSGATCIPQDSMVCKKRGPTLQPFGPWVNSTPTNPAATVAPGTVDVVVDHGASATDMFGITNGGDVGSTLNYTLDLSSTSCASPAAVSWLSVAPISGAVAQAATSTITATVNAMALTAGSYSAFICVHSNDTAQPLISVPVSVTVNVPPAPTAAVSTASLSLSVVAGASTSGPFTLGNTGAAGSTLHFTIDATTPAWLSAAPASGSIAQGSPAVSITATANAASLAPGNYTGTINVHSDDSANPTVPVSVNLSVSAPAPTAAVSPGSLSFSFPQGGNGNATFDVGNSGSPGSTLHYTIDTASTSCASPGPVIWLSRSPAAGSVAQGGPADTVTITADSSSLAPGSYSALVCVHTDDPAHALIAVPVSLSATDVIFFDGFDPLP
ncbi:MAG: hypothetical protein ABIQ70_10165 [Dokdonella sp.]